MSLRRAQRPSSLAEGHREAARSGLDGGEHGATLGQGAPKASLDHNGYFSRLRNFGFRRG
jgi:hypothetical protein